MPKKSADAKKPGDAKSTEGKADGKKGSAAQRALAALNLPKDFPLGKASAKALGKHPLMAELAAIALEALAGEIRARVRQQADASAKPKAPKRAATASTAKDAPASAKTAAPAAPVKRPAAQSRKPAAPKRAAKPKDASPS